MTKVVGTSEHHFVILNWTFLRHWEFVIRHFN